MWNVPNLSRTGRRVLFHVEHLLTPKMPIPLKVHSYEI